MTNYLENVYLSETATATITAELRKMYFDKNSHKVWNSTFYCQQPSSCPPQASCITNKSTYECKYDTDLMNTSVIETVNYNHSYRLFKDR